MSESGMTFWDSPVAVDGMKVALQRHFDFLSFKEYQNIIPNDWQPISVSTKWHLDSLSQPDINNSNDNLNSNEMKDEFSDESKAVKRHRQSTLFSLMLGLSNSPVPPPPPPPLIIASARQITYSQRGKYRISYILLHNYIITLSNNTQSHNYKYKLKNTNFSHISISAL
jgi:hypothetical protein